MRTYQIGVDVGGTNTDAVILDDNLRVVSEAKSPTTRDVSSGIYESMKKVITHAHVDKSLIKHAMLGTTHCTNAIVERERLNSIAIIRIGAPAGMSVKPLVGAPDDLRSMLDKHVYIVHGGSEVDGREIAALDETELYRIARAIKGSVDSVAITSIFSPVTESHETRASEIIKEVLGNDMPVTLSSEIGSLGLLDRENSAILNSSIINVAKTAVEGFSNALKEEGIDAKVFLGQNDGTLMFADYAVKYPIFTVASGPTNSLRGASYLTGESDALVIDVGGTTTDIGVLSDSFPRESSIAVEIGGVRTNFRMPDLVSVGLGGGTVIHVQDNDTFQIGPDSVGYQLTEKALIFGGDTLTATDIVVALGKANIGDPSKVRNLDDALLKKIYAEMVATIEVALDQMKTSANPVPVILVGGGSILVPEELEGASRVIRSNNYEVANALGAVIAQVSGEIERVFSLDELGREETIQKAKQMAVNDAVNAGADAKACDIIDLEDIPLSYLPGNATRIRAKAAGPLASV